MTSRRRHLVATSALLLGFVGHAAGITAAQRSLHATYQVTLQNLTTGQPLSPPVAATHREHERIFRVGQPASDQLAAIVQAGDPLPLFTRLNGADRVSQAVNVGRPLTTQGAEKVVMGTTLTDSAAFAISAAPGDKFSLATMLICTNDGFAGLDAVELPQHGARTYILHGYDAGREENTEQSEDIVDPCSLLGPTSLVGDPDGNADAAVATMPGQVIQFHSGIQGMGDLSAAAHGWEEPVAQITITRID